MGVRDPQSEIEVHDQLVVPVTVLLRRCQDSGAIRSDVAMSDIGFVLMMLCPGRRRRGRRQPRSVAPLTCR